MELIPKSIQTQIPPLYSTEDMKSPTVYVKLILDGWTWLITELSIDGDICFGYVISLFCDGELGYFSLSEIKELKDSLGLAVECDENFKPCKLSEIKKAS